MVPSPRVVGLSEVDVLIDDLIEARETRPVRWVLGITGPPGSGKSALADRVVQRVGNRMAACVAPMDGFHLSNEELVSLGLVERKGVPASFDAAGFVGHLELLHRPGPVAWPTFDRSREETVPAGHIIESDVQLVVVEGNYLLLDTPPWDLARFLIDQAWYLDVPEDVLISRLRTRHELARTPEDAWAKIQSTDLPNAKLVAKTRTRADIVIA